ncbi:hypothetical protein BH11PAT4_BH11PAT4_3340 [soil metagenome]
MKLQFDANQEYQLEAVQSVVDVFEGQPLLAEDFSVVVGSNSKNLQIIDEQAVANSLGINESQLLQNIQGIQARNGVREKVEIENSPLLTEDGDYILTESGLPITTEEDSFKNGRNFTLEMETGTGKTYVYLRTIHELNKTYGFKKFIIVVPSVAIREGVLKNLEITRPHFASIYGNPSMDWYVWNPKKRGQARQFATNDSMQILIVTIDSFTRAENIINQQSDWGVPLEYIRATHPIVIVDEPQNMETEVRRKAIESLNPLCTLRYSATHKNAYTMLYRLDPVKAYDLGLVKRIEVDSVYAEDAFNSAYLHLVKIERSGKSGLVAHVELDRDDAAGLQRQILKLQSGDDLLSITGREVYRDFIVDTVSADDQSVEFSNGHYLKVGQKNEALHEEITKYQIQRTIENHFEKEKRLKERGVKVLSLFFLDKVSNYRIYENSAIQKGKFAQWFEEIYREVQSKPKYSGLIPFEAEAVHGGYFSADRSGQWKDTRGDTQTDDDTYGLIMKDKERLLDPSVPLRFIFSHSALREGWDSPNVFQICTLNETSSEMKKRQEIGRGLRLPVDIYGQRVIDTNVNVLTVIANESYEDFARKLQTEIEEETGVQFTGRIKNKKERRLVQLRKGYELDQNFTELWERIKQKTQYQVTFDTNELIDKAAVELSQATITRPRISSTRAELVIGEGGINTLVRDGHARQVEYGEQLVIPDVLGKLQAHSRLTRQTIYEILNRAGKIDDVLVNPQQVIDEARRVIERVMRQLMVDGIKYERIDGAAWEMQRFENDELFAYLDGLVEVHEPEKTLYDHVLVDSGVERTFASELEERDDIKFYFKLPGWFKIETPLGGYNPDWAIVFEQDEKVYFVAETKGVSDIFDEGLKDSERAKIRCGEAHFKTLSGISFIGPIQSARELLP